MFLVRWMKFSICYISHCDSSILLVHTWSLVWLIVSWNAWQSTLIVFSVNKSNHLHMQNWTRAPRSVIFYYAYNQFRCVSLHDWYSPLWVVFNYIRQDSICIALHTILYFIYLYLNKNLVTSCSRLRLPLHWNREH